jgi:hypothetical protein
MWAMVIPGVYVVAADGEAERLAQEMRERFGPLAEEVWEVGVEMDAEELVF